MNSFDWTTYLNNYPDLKMSGINDKKTAYKHWIKFGKIEGRTDKSVNDENNNILSKDINELINGISCIAWINLDRSNHRKIHMEKLLNNLDINNKRISAVDGLCFDFKQKIIDVNIKREFTPVEKACSLSHIKAINMLKNMDGEYFMICEDDITFDNTYLFKNTDLENIIKNAPPFDILQLSKIFYNKLPNTYNVWNKNIQGTGCYIITKSAILKISSIVSYNEIDDTFTFNNEHVFEVADIFIYGLVNTIVYKYSFISLLDEDSTIHSNHLCFHKKSSQIQKDIILNNISKHNL